MGTTSIKSSFSIFLIIGFAIFVLFSLGHRYLEWGISSNLVISFELISILSFAIMFYSFLKKNPITPLFLYSIFIFLLGYSFIPLNKFNESYSNYDFILLALTIFFFLCGIFCGNKLHLYITPFSVSVRHRIWGFWCVVSLSLLIFLLESLRLGYIPLTRIFTSNVYNAMNENTIPVLHYFTQAANIIPIWAYVLYKEGFLTKKRRNIAIVIALFVVLNSLSRQMWLLSMICIGLCYMYYYTVSKQKLLIYMTAAVLLFGIIGAVRLLTTISDDRSNTEYLKTYASTQYDTNLLETYIGLYSTNNFTTFKEFVENADKQDYRGYGVYTFRPIYTILFLNKIKGFDISSDFNSFSALGTYAIDPYLDFGILGIIFLNFIYGFVLAYTHKMYTRKYYRWIIPWGILAFCVLMAAFTNYFNTFFVWFMISLNFFILPPSFKYA